MWPAATIIDVGTLYASDGDWLKDWLRRYTLCSHRAADLAQDTFCRVLERPESGIRDSRSYLATVARAYLALHPLRMGDTDHLTPQRIVEAAELLSAILRVIETLPDKTRRAFLLVRFDGLR